MAKSKIVIKSYWFSVRGAIEREREHLNELSRECARADRPDQNRTSSWSIKFDAKMKQVGSTIRAAMGTRSRFKCRQTTAPLQPQPSQGTALVMARGRSGAQSNTSTSRPSTARQTRSGTWSQSGTRADWGSASTRWGVEAVHASNWSSDRNQRNNQLGQQPGPIAHAPRTSAESLKSNSPGLRFSGSISHKHQNNRRLDQSE